jgi:hypothetical protein
VSFPPVEDTTEELHSILVNRPAMNERSRSVVERVDVNIERGAGDDLNALHDEIGFAEYACGFDV